MPRFVVLLRGVNVGTGNRVPMAAFRAVLEARGGSDVRTLLNSGNAVFRATGRSTTAQAKAIGAGLQESLGVGVLVVVKSAAEFLTAVAENSIVPRVEDHSRFLVAFAQSESTVQGLSALQPMLRPAESLRLGKHAAYLYCADGILQSRAGSALLGRLGREVTTRNWATVIKLKMLLSGPA